MLLWLLDKLHAQKLKLVGETAQVRNSHLFTQEWKHGFIEQNLQALKQLESMWTGVLILKQTHESDFRSLPTSDSVSKSITTLCVFLTPPFSNTIFRTSDNLAFLFPQAFAAPCPNHFKVCDTSCLYHICLILLSLCVCLMRKDMCIDCIHASICICVYRDYIYNLYHTCTPLY